MKKLVIFIAIILISGCTNKKVSPKPKIDSPKGTPIRIAKIGYGNPPKDYINKIKNYFSKRIKNSNRVKYIFSKPVRAYKIKSDTNSKIEWRGWLVDVLVSTPDRLGKLLKPKPYIILFKNSQIIGDIVGDRHKLIIRVDSGKL